MFGAVKVNNLKVSTQESLPFSLKLRLFRNFRKSVLVVSHGVKKNFNSSNVSNTLSL